MTVPNQLFAMDTHFMRSQPTPEFVDQARWVKEAGYDAYYLTHMASIQPCSLDQALDACTQADIPLSGVYELPDISSAPENAELERLNRMMTRLPTGCRIEIAMNGLPPGDPSTDEKALAWLNPLLEIAKGTGHQLALYPHFSFTLETFTDALRLARILDHEQVKCMFCAYHWHHIHCFQGKEPSPEKLLKEAGDLLAAVNVNGSRLLKEPEDIYNGMNPTIEPLGRGDLDCRSIVHTLREMNFTGPIGIQGYAVSEEPVPAIQESFQTLTTWLTE